MALTREYTAEDPLSFVGQLVAAPPYEAHECKELMNVDYSGEGRAGSTIRDSDE